MNRYDSLDNLIHKIYKFVSLYSKTSIKDIIVKTPTNNEVILKTNINNISIIILKYIQSLRLKKDIHRQDFITDKIIQYIQRIKPELIDSNLVVADIGGGNGDVISGINNRVNGHKDNFICVETQTDWVEDYPRDNENILYKFWNNNVIDIDDNSCDVVLCMVSLHHMTPETIRNTFEEIKRILKNDGLLLIKEHDTNCRKTQTLIEWEHHLYHILDCAYNNILTNADEYISKSINNFNSKVYWQSILEEHGFKLRHRTNRFLDGEFIENDSRNPTNLYWDLYSKD